MKSAGQLVKVIVEVVIAGTLIYALYDQFGTLADDFDAKNATLLAITFRVIVPTLLSVAVVYVALKLIGGSK
jgi:hypothetical protein